MISAANNFRLHMVDTRCPRTAPQAAVLVAFQDAHAQPLCHSVPSLCCVGFTTDTVLCRTVSAAGKCRNVPTGRVSARGRTLPDTKTQRRRNFMRSTLHCGTDGSPVL